MNAAQMDLVLTHLPIVATAVGLPILLACLGIVSAVARASAPGGHR